MEETKNKSTKELVATCPSCGHEFFLICNNCEKQDQWVLLEDSQVTCNCEAQFTGWECPECDADIAPKFFSVPTPEQVEAIHETEKTQERKDALSCLVVLCILAVLGVIVYNWLKPGEDYEQVADYWDQARSVALEDSIAAGQGTFSVDAIYTELFAQCRKNLEWSKDRCGNAVIMVRKKNDEHAAKQAK